MEENGTEKTIFSSKKIYEIYKKESLKNWKKTGYYLTVESEYLP